MKSTTRLLAFICAIIGLAGCGVTIPSVQYAEYSEEAISKAGGDVGGYTFRYRRSVIVLEYDINGKEFTAQAAPYELKADGSYGTLYRIWGIDKFYSKTTQLKVSYVDNTKFIDQLQVTTKDNIADTIQKIGEVGKAVVPLAAAAFVSAPPEKEAKPKKFNKTIVDPAKTGIDQWTDDPLNQGYCLRLKDVVSESSLLLQKYIDDGLGKWQGTFPVPACSIGVVEIAEASKCADVKPGDIKASISVKFADAYKVLPVSLPSSGSVKMNSICGASVTEADKQDRDALLEILSNFITEAQGISAAWKKAKDEKEATPEKPKAGQ